MRWVNFLFSMQHEAGGRNKYGTLPAFPLPVAAPDIFFPFFSLMLISNRPDHHFRFYEQRFLEISFQEEEKVGLGETKGD